MTFLTTVCGPSQWPKGNSLTTEVHIRYKNVFNGLTVRITAAYKKKILTCVLTSDYTCMHMKIVL